MEKPQMISIAGLKARGWTQAFITLLGEPDMVRRNSHYAKLAPMRLYDTVRSFLRGVVLAAKAKAAGRQCGAKTAVETKRAALMQQVLEMQVSVEPGTLGETCGDRIANGTGMETGRRKMHPPSFGEAQAHPGNTFSPRRIGTKKRYAGTVIFDGDQVGFSLPGDADGVLVTMSAPRAQTKAAFAGRPHVPGLRLDRQASHAKRNAGCGVRGLACPH